MKMDATTREDYYKVIQFGKFDGYGNGRKTCAVDVRVQILTTGDKTRLSIQGSLWNSLHSDILGGGQNLEELGQLVKTPKMREIVKVWREWHLNDMRAACQHQRERGETWTTHPSAVCPDCGYVLGSQWLYEELPQSIIDQVKGW